MYVGLLGLIVRVLVIGDVESVDFIFVGNEIDGDAFAGVYDFGNVGAVDGELVVRYFYGDCLWGYGGVSRNWIDVYVCGVCVVVWGLIFCGFEREVNFV